MFGFTAAKNGIEDLRQERRVGVDEPDRQPLAAGLDTGQGALLLVERGAALRCCSRTRPPATPGRDDTRATIERANAAAVTFEPSLNLIPLFTVKVYVFPSLETVGRPVAASGTSWLPPAEAGLSG